MGTMLRIRELRKTVGISQQELANRLGYKSGSAITMWETGERNPPSTILPRLAKELGCTIDTLFAGSDQDSA